MSSTSRVWMVGASIGIVEALKDQGICRWNYALRLLHQYSKSFIRSYAQPKMISAISSSSSAVVSNKLRNDMLKQSEESLRTVMYLSCWGPN